MKRPSSLSVSDFQKMLDAMCASAASETAQMQARLEALRSDQQPPG
jgi:hypothetical protein